HLGGDAAAQRETCQGQLVPSGHGTTGAVRVGRRHGGVDERRGVAPQPVGGCEGSESAVVAVIPHAAGMLWIRDRRIVIVSDGGARHRPTWLDTGGGWRGGEIVTADSSRTVGPAAENSSLIVTGLPKAPVRKGAASEGLDPGAIARRISERGARGQ